MNPILQLIPSPAEGEIWLHRFHGPVKIVKPWDDHTSLCIVPHDHPYSEGNYTLPNDDLISTSATREFSRSLSAIAAAIALLLFVGCAMRPQKPGGSTMRSAHPGLAEFRAELKQPENPAQGAEQNYERTTEVELPIPAGSSVRETTTVAPKVKGEAPAVREVVTILKEPVVQRTKTTEKAGLAIGAAQKDTARELTARLKSLSGVVYVGVALLLFGLATIGYPPLRIAIGSMTTSLVIVAGGLALIILPNLIVGHELIVLSGVGVAVAGYFFAHRHGVLKGKVETLGEP